MKPHAGIPDHGIDWPFAERIDRHAPQRHREPQSEPAHRQSAGHREHYARESAGREAAVRGLVDRGHRRVVA
jgi:hypothetical protein